MTVRYSILTIHEVPLTPKEALDAYTPNARVLHYLWHAQQGYCSVCGEKMPGINWSPMPSEQPTVEHVFPRNPRPEYLAKIAAFKLVARSSRRKTAAHARCNSAKSNRPPTGCEVIWLMAVNARLGWSR